MGNHLFSESRHPKRPNRFPSFSIVPLHFRSSVVWGGVSESVSVCVCVLRRKCRSRTMADIVKRSKELHLEMMRGRMDDYNQKYKDSLAYFKKLEHQLTFLKSEIAGNRSKLKFTSSISAKVFYGHNAVKQNVENTKTLLVNLEKRHHGLLLRKGEWEMVNAEKRVAINKLRYKQKIARETERKLREQFRVMQSDFAKILAECSRISGERDHVDSRVRATEETESIEIEAYEEEMTNLTRYIREQNEITEQLKRVGTKLHDSKKEEHLTKEEEEKMRQEMHHHEDATQKSSKTLSKMSYKTAFEILMEESGQTKINTLVHLYLARTDEIFKLYNIIQRRRQDLTVATSSLEQSRARLRKYIESEGEQHKKHLNMLSTVREQKQKLVSGIERVKSSYEKNRERVEAWCQHVQSMVNTYLGRKNLLRTEPALKVLENLVNEYKLRNGCEWEVPDYAIENSDDEDDGVSSGLSSSRRFQARSRRQRRRVSTMVRRKTHSARNEGRTPPSKKGGNGEDNDATATEESVPPLIEPHSLQVVLGSVEEMCLSMIDKLKNKAINSTALLKLGIASDAFTAPRCGSRREQPVIVKESAIPTAIVDDSELEDEYTGVELIDLSACRKEFREMNMTTAYKKKSRLHQLHERSIGNSKKVSSSSGRKHRKSGMIYSSSNRGMK